MSRFVAKCYGRFRGRSTVVWCSRKSLALPSTTFDIELFYLELSDLRKEGSAQVPSDPSPSDLGDGGAFYQSFDGMRCVWIEAESDARGKLWALLPLGLVEIRRWRVLRGRVVGETVYGDMIGEACFEWPP